MKRLKYIPKTPGTGEYWTVEIENKIFDGAGCYRWRETFAWFPVKTLAGKYVWLRKIYKQRYWAIWGRGFHMETEVEYAELFDLLKYEQE